MLALALVLVLALEEDDKMSKEEQKKMFHLRNEETFTRMHLRKEKKGQGILIVNANRIFHLNKTATEFIEYIIKEMKDEEIIRKMVNKYNVHESEIRTDLMNLKIAIEDIVNKPDIDPVQELFDEDMEIERMIFSAPLRMDLAITYKCNNKCVKCYVEKKREIKELKTEEWKKVLDKLWDIGVPHVTFTGGEPTTRKDLVKLVEYAEDIGIVTGLITNGRNLKDKNLVDELVAAGIDHFQITIESHLPEVHDKLTGVKGSWEETVEGIKNVVPTPVFIMTNTTLVPENINEIDKTIEFLASLGIDHFAANGIIKAGGGKNDSLDLTVEELNKTLDTIMKKAEEMKMRFLWYSPTRYCEFNPVKKGLGVKQCTAANIAMAIEPDGQVIPCQSYFDTLGNILTTPWKKIWNHKTAKRIRKRKYLPQECKKCPEKEICGGGCPLNYEAPSTVCRDALS